LSSDFLAYHINAYFTMARSLAQLVLHPLHNADGSATYTGPNDTHTIIAGINYPVEVPYRSDEIPDSTFIEVNLRPHNGVAMVKERHVESLVKQTLQSIVRIEETPRMMLQVTLQVASAETDEDLPGGIKGGGQGETYLPVLASALNAALLACLDGAVKMKQTAGAALIGIKQDGTPVENPRAAERKKCKSLHVFALTGSGEVILMQSEGAFSLEEWTGAQELGRRLVVDMGDTSLLGVMRRAVEAGAKAKQRWRGE
jgi:exosome complex component RRP46